MRVIAGSAGGIRLDVPRRGVRPTMDRVKAAIFSSLADAVIGQKILDLFAGTGGLGIEALSRGASSVLFVDSDRQSIATIEKNLVKAKLDGRVRQQDVFEFLRRSSLKEKFRIIFADPPYEKTPTGERFTDKLLTHEALPQLLEDNGIFVLEKHPSEALPETPFWNLIRRKKYGATEVLFLQHAPVALTACRKSIPSGGGAACL
jgi:16S rRNA (guanine966-N2)-methyltransferase